MDSVMGRHLEGKHQVTYPYYNRICVCLYRRISLTDEPIGFSLRVSLTGPGKVYNNYGKGTTILPTYYVLFLKANI